MTYTTIDPAHTVTYSLDISDILTRNSHSQFFSISLKTQQSLLFLLHHYTISTNPVPKPLQHLDNSKTTSTQKRRAVPWLRLRGRAWIWRASSFIFLASANGEWVASPLPPPTQILPPTGYGWCTRYSRVGKGYSWSGSLETNFCLSGIPLTWRSITLLTILPHHQCIKSAWIQ